MEHRARTRPLLRRAGLLVALTALLAPATPATADAAKRKKRLPVVTKVAPKKAFVGDTLTIRGRHFRRGIKKNAVAFKRRGAKVVLVKTGKSTKKLLKVTLPKRLEKVLRVRNGTPVATRLKLRVLSGRFGRRYTKRSRSPLIGPEKPPAPPKPPTVDPNADCDGDEVVNRVDADDDNDLLSDVAEVGYKLDPCKPDTDGDGSWDGYEYGSARDLNDDGYQSPNSYAPYPGKRPYPNPLDRTDAGTDFDGDSLTLSEEFRLWRYTVARGAAVSIDALTYSDGKKYSVAQPAAGYAKRTQFLNAISAGGYWMVRLPGEGSPRPLLDANRDGVVNSGSRPGYLHAEDHWLDRDGDARLSDDERDEDADGLSNHDESHGHLDSTWWEKRYPRETRFRITYGGTAFDDPDSDGDTILDGADDQDHDDVPNLMELSRNMATGRTFDAADTPRDATLTAAGTPLAEPAYGRVNPFNPCLPHTSSRTCPTYIPFTGAWAPFDGLPWDPDGDDPNYLVRN
jgi:hypothetical protein